MNTERDNFHDWARDKPDTAFNALPQERRASRELPREQGTRWGWMVLLVVLAVALVVGFKMLAGL